MVGACGGGGANDDAATLERRRRLMSHVSRALLDAYKAALHGAIGARGARVVPGACGEGSGRGGAVQSGPRQPRAARRSEAWAGVVGVFLDRLAVARQGGGAGQGARRALAIFQTSSCGGYLL